MKTDEDAFSDYEVTFAEEDWSWQDSALCAQIGGDPFFIEKGGLNRTAKHLCMQCEVRAECLESALKRDEQFGVWGGKTIQERRQIKRQRLAANNNPSN